MEQDLIVETLQHLGEPNLAAFGIQKVRSIISYRMTLLFK